MLFASQAQAWNAAGHMITGAIAYDLLKQEDPQALAKAVAILRQHPKFADSFADKLDAVGADERERYLFMLAARWPDDVRMNRAYHHGPWHYINYPFVPPGQPSSVSPRPPSDPNVLTALRENGAILTGSGSATDKAVALCWVLHLVGDVHQPLHTVAMFTTAYTDGDKGGNEVWVKAEADRAPINLHSLWDGLVLGTGSKYRDAANIATELRLRPEFAKAKHPEFAEKDPEKWARESLTIATTVVYANGKVQGSPDRGTATVLPSGYAKQGKSISELRMITAGSRLADALKRAMK